MKQSITTTGRGFTLVEVMVALTILSLIMLTTITSLRTLGNTQGSIDRLTERVDDMRTMSGFLRDTLESTVVGGTSGGLAFAGQAASVGTTYFEMEPKALIWKSTVQFGEGYGGSHFLRVAQEENNLVMRWQELTQSGVPGKWESAPSRVMVHKLEDFELAYRREFKEDWQVEWDGAGLPALVRARLKVAGRYWPDLIMQVPR